jgi:hypothetical protein
VSESENRKKSLAERRRFSPLFSVVKMATFDASSNPSKVCAIATVAAFQKGGDAVATRKS